MPPAGYSLRRTARFATGGLFLSNLTPSNQRGKQLFDGPGVVRKPAGYCERAPNRASAELSKNGFDFAAEGALNRGEMTI
jgi:hypothetical protein